MQAPAEAASVEKNRILCLSVVRALWKMENFNLRNIKIKEFRSLLALLLALIYSPLRNFPSFLFRFFGGIESKESESACETEPSVAVCVCACTAFCNIDFFRLTDGEHGEEKRRKGIFCDTKCFGRNTSCVDSSIGRCCCPCPSPFEKINFAVIRWCTPNLYSIDCQFNQEFIFGTLGPNIENASLGEMAHCTKNSLSPVHLPLIFTKMRKIPSIIRLKHQRRLF